MTDANGGEKRVTCKRRHPNPHLLELLKSLYKDAVDAGSPYVPSLKLAISSIEQYPLPLNCGSECAILKGFDAKLCRYIDGHIKEISKSKKSKLNDKLDPTNELDISSKSEGSSSESEKDSDSKKNHEKNNCQEINTASNVITKSNVNDKVDHNNEVEISSTSEESSSDSDMASDSKKNPKKDNSQEPNTVRNGNTMSKGNDKVHPNNEVEISSKPEEISSDSEMAETSSKSEESSSDSEMASDSKNNCQVKNAASNANTNSKVNNKVDPNNEVEISSKSEDSSSDSEMGSDSKNNCPETNTASNTNTNSKVNNKVDPNNEVEISSKSEDSSSDSEMGSDSKNYCPETNAASNANTNSKVNNKVDPNNEVETSDESSADSEMASNSKNNCKVTSAASNANTAESADEDIQSDDASAENPTSSSTRNGETHNGEQNNNVAKSLYLDNGREIDADLDLKLYLHSYFVNKGERGLENESYKSLYEVLELQKDCFHDANLSADQDVEYEKSQVKKKHESEIGKCYVENQTVDLCNDSGSDEPVNESSDEETDQPKPSECRHQEQVVYCKQCLSISMAADAFKSYYKGKVKKDAEEIEKCVLPRKIFAPSYRSGAYAILIALLEQRNECPYRDLLTKDELIRKAQKHTDQSFTCPDPVSHYTAWTNVSRLISKGLMKIMECEHRSLDVYMLTAMGRAIAMELSQLHTPKVTVNDVIYRGRRNNRVPSLDDVVLVPPPPLVMVNEDQNSVFIEMPPGTFDIVMLIDKRENFKTNMPASPNNYCKYESRCISIGDFLWVARSKKTGQELVLPYIVERKRIDDLSSSIKDGRYNEQKFRLRKCGLPNVLYLVESCKTRKQTMLPPASLMQAIVNTSVMDDFNIIKTESMEHTFRFLGMLSESLVHEFSPTFLRGSNRDTQGKELMTFEYFNKLSSKNRPLTIKDTFTKMLLQLKGLSVEKALAITKVYNSPRALMKAYARCPGREGEMLLANLKFNNVTQNVGPAVSKTLYKLFSSLEI